MTINVGGYIVDDENVGGTGWMVIETDNQNHKNNNPKTIKQK